MEATDDRSGFAVIDVETTGFSPEDERIVEVGVVILDPEGEEVRSFTTLIDPHRDPGPTEVHRISVPMLEGAPTFEMVHPYLAEQLSGRVVVGHNVDGFDLPFLRAECRRHGGPALAPCRVPSVDTLAVAQVHLGLQGRARLVDCCTHFGLTWDDHHSALADAKVTAALFRAMRDRLGDDILGIDDLLVAAHGSAWPGASGCPPTFRGRAPISPPATVTAAGSPRRRRRFRPWGWWARSRSRRLRQASAHQAGPDRSAIPARQR
jgi:DNA polymerase III subunit epsilon